MAGTREVGLKIGAIHDDRAALDIFACASAPMTIPTAQGLTGFFAGQPRVQPVVRLADLVWGRSGDKDGPVLVDPLQFRVLGRVGIEKKFSNGQLSLTQGGGRTSRASGSLSLPPPRSMRRNLAA
ncbi:hypothetical protein ABIE69_002161 [Rhodobacteraceae bacterium MBR-64]|jgi:hypothetical protein